MLYTHVVIITRNDKNCLTTAEYIMDVNNTMKALNNWKYREKISDEKIVSY